MGSRGSIAIERSPAPPCDAGGHHPTHVAAHRGVSVLAPRNRSTARADRLGYPYSIPRRLPRVLVRIRSTP